MHCCIDKYRTLLVWRVEPFRSEAKYCTLSRIISMIQLPRCFPRSQAVFVCYFILGSPSKLHRSFGRSGDGRYCGSTESATAEIGHRNSVRAIIGNNRISEILLSLTLSPEPPRPRSSSRPGSSPRPSAPRGASPSAAPSRPPP